MISKFNAVANRHVAVVRAWSESLVGGSMIYAAAEAVSRAADFLFLLYMARKTVPARYGEFTYVFGTLQVLFIVIDMGLIILASREVARQPDRTSTTVSELLGLKLTLTALFLISEILVVALFVRSALKLTCFAALTIGLGCDTFGEMFESVLLAHRRIAATSVSRIVRNAVIAVVGITLLGFGQPVAVVVFAFAAGGLVHLVFPACMLHGSHPVRVSFHWSAMYRLIREAVPLALVSIFIWTYLRMNVQIVQYFHGDEQQGFLGVAMKVQEGVLLFLTAATRVVFPRMTTAATNDPLRVRWLVSRVQLMLEGFLVPGVVVLWWFAAPLFKLAFGEEYAAAVPVFRLLVWVVPIIVLSHPLYYLVIAVGRQKHNVRVMGFGLAANVVCNLVFVPKYGALGAALASIVTESFILMQLLWYAYRVIYPELSRFAEEKGVEVL